LTTSFRTSNFYRGFSFAKSSEGWYIEGQKTKKSITKDESKKKLDSENLDGEKLDGGNLGGLDSGK
jgi:hypothetical protein